MSEDNDSLDAYSREPRYSREHRGDIEIRMPTQRTLNNKSKKV